VIRAGLVAMATVTGSEESVLQIVLGGAYAPSTVPVILSSLLDTFFTNACRC